MPMLVVFVICGVEEAKNGVLIIPFGGEESRDHSKDLPIPQEQKQQPLVSPDLPCLGRKKRRCDS